MKLRLVLWLLGRMMLRACAKNKEFKKTVSGMNAVFQLMTGNGRVIRQYAFSGGSMTTESSIHLKPDCVLRFRDANYGFQVLTSKDKNAFLNGMKRGDIIVDGEFKYLIMFQQITGLLKKKVKPAPEGLNPVGFVGTGIIGAPMARSLLRNGFKVLAFDRDPEKLKSVISEGAAACSSLADMKNARAVIVMVNNMKQANDVVDEIIGSLPKDSSMPFIIMSTVSPVEMKELRSKLDKSGRGSIRLADSPVSGLPLLAEAGKLSLMFGGDRVLFEELMLLFEAMADPEKIFYMGPLGSGSAMKLVNNMIGFTASLAACEAMDLGVRGGLSTEMMARVIDVSSGKNFITDQWQLSRKLFEAMLSGADQTAKDAVFTTGQKDLGIAGEWAEKIGVRLEISEIAVKHMKSIDNEKFESVLRNLVKK